jgi:hypothetical protein
MTCKRWATVCVLLALLLCTAMPAWATEAEIAQGWKPTESNTEEQETLPDGNGQILLLYAKTPTEQQTKNIAVIADAATALGYSLDFGTWAQCTDVLNKYSFVICYDLDAPDDAFWTRLVAYTGKLFVLGGEEPTRFWTTKVGAFNGTEQSGAFSGHASYSFTSNNTEESFTALTDAKHLLFFTESEYENGSFYTNNNEAPLFVQADGIRYCPLTDFTDEVLHAAFIQELNNWLWQYLDMPTSYPQYLVLDAVYPFMPTDQLMERVDACIEASMPFVISVMPIFQNAEYPAMQQFCEVLRYAQANQGAVILHAPLSNTGTFDRETLQELLTTATEAYTTWGVYPLGIEVPQSWTQDEEMLELLKRYRTVFVYDDGTEPTIDLSTHKNLLYYNYHQLILPLLALDDTGLSYLSNYSSALYIDSLSDMDELSTQLERMKNSRVPLKSLWSLSHSVWCDNFYLSYTGDTLTVNGVEQDLRYTPEMPIEDFDYNRDILYRITVSLEKQNKGVIVFACGTALLFLCFILYARIVNRRRFFTPTKKH